MGAATTIVLALIEPGETIALAEGAYYGTAVLFRTLDRWGVRVVEYDQTGPPPEGADVIWVESPANPVLTLPGWDAVRGRARLLVCDATVSTPVYLRALDEGADVVLHSGTKYLCGRHDALVGATVTRNEELTERLRTMRGQAGITASPDAAHALHVGLETLEARMRRHTETATVLAARLGAHPVVERVRYPGFSGLVSFDVTGDPRAVETATRLIVNATSLGGATSTMESRHRWEGDRIPTGLLRLSVGLEDADALWADLAQALRTVSK
jgi:cystathionine gamma-synthase